MNILDKINSPVDVKGMPEDELDALCAELREFLIRSVSKTGGHLASNLGTVELTVALHRVFDTSHDKLIFDVGHQSYVHKILTGRKDGFENLRRLHGLSGFPKPSESSHDAFIAGHASTSISAALGMARARTLSRRDYHVVAVIGDGALTGGLAFEGLSDAGESGEGLIIILNDNGMSITKNVGGIAHYLSRQRIKPSYAAFKKRYRRLMEILPGGRCIYGFTHSIKSAVKEALLHCSMFEEMGLQYIGPVDGHDIKRLEEALNWAKQLQQPVLVHATTQKGRGYGFAEREPEKYHGVKPFNYKDGVPANDDKSFSDVFGETICELAGKNPRICAITASMASGTGLSGFAKQFPDRFFDVGIAEGHAVTMAAGLASQGMVPVFAVYSTFLQRSYDMLMHDAGIGGLHAVFAVDRAGIVAGDGETHQGVFDAAYLSTVPGMTVLSPASYAELRDMLAYAVDTADGPVAVRYPRGGEGEYRDGGIQTKRMLEGGDFTVVTYGININTALETARMLVRDGISAEIIKLGAINPIGFDDIEDSVKKTNRLLVLEDSAENGGVGERIAARLLRDKITPDCVILMNTGNRFLPCGELKELQELCGIDAHGVYNAIREALGNE